MIDLVPVIDHFLVISGRLLEVRKMRDCTIYVTKINALISCAVTAQLICAFVFANAKSIFHMTRLICHMTSFYQNFVTLLILSLLLNKR